MILMILMFYRHPIMKVMDEILNECIISSLNSASAPPNANYNT